MLKPNKAILKQIKAYDKKLDAKWNNKECYWEIWYKMPWGNRLITPIVESIYREGGGISFHPLDSKIIGWLRSADSQKSSNKWKWINRKRFNEKAMVRDNKTKVLFENIAKDNYNLINQELISPTVDTSDWLEPDIQSKSSRRIAYRSADNTKEYFNDPS